MNNSRTPLFVPKRFDRVETGCATGGQHTEQDAGDRAGAEGDHHGHGGNAGLDRREAADAKRRAGLKRKLADYQREVEGRVKQAEE